MSLVRDLVQTYARIICSVVSLVVSFTAAAHAQAAPGAAAPSPLLQMVPLIVIVGVMYFLVMRPQMKKQKDHAAFITQLKRGEEVLTTGGILGRIEGLTDLYVTLEIAPGVRIRILRSQIASNMPTASGVTSEVKA